jgi:hypothetical protein
MKISALIVISALLGGTGGYLFPIDLKVQPTYTYEIALRERFAHPASVELRNVRLAPDGRSYCGEVNGRDRHGDFVGFRQFRVFGTHGTFMILIAESAPPPDNTQCN